MTRLAYLSSLAAAELAEARRNYAAAWLSARDMKLETKRWRSLGRAKGAMR